MSPEFPEGILETVNPRMRNLKQSIGAILVDAGKITAFDAERIARLQRELGLSFGDTAISLGLLTHADIEFALARQYDYPYLSSSERALVSPELVAALQPFSAPVESMRALRSQLMLNWFNKEINGYALAVTGPQRGDGRSYLVANLAIVFSQLGQRTLLIDADLRHSRQHQIFSVNNGSGLSSILSGRRQAHSIQHIEHFANLSILTAGPAAPNPQELLGRSAFPELLDELESEYDVVLIDTPAGNEYADTQTLSALAGGAILAVRRDHTKLDEANKMATEMAQHGVQVLGAVLSEFD